MAEIQPITSTTRNQGNLASQKNITLITQFAGSRRPLCVSIKTICAILTNNIWTKYRLNFCIFEIYKSQKNGTGIYHRPTDKLNSEHSFR